MLCITQSYAWQFLEVEITHVDFAEESCDIGDVRLQKLIQADHVSLLCKENVVGQILHDFSDDHEASTDGSIVFGHFNID